MSNPRVFDPPKSDGQKVPASEFNALDEGQFNALCRKGNTPLLANTTIQGAGFAFTIALNDDAASLGQINNGANDFAFNALGAGFFTFTASKLKLLGTGWPVMDTRAVTNYVPHCHVYYNDTAHSGHPNSFLPDTVNGAYSQVDHDGLYVLAFWLSLPIGTVIKSLSVPFKKSDGDALPTTMPTIQLGYLDLATGAYTLVAGIKTDPSATLADYKLYHLVTTDAVTHTVAGGRNYVVFVSGDNTANDGGFDLSIYRPFLSVETSTLRHL